MDSIKKCEVCEGEKGWNFNNFGHSDWRDCPDCKGTGVENDPELCYWIKLSRYYCDTRCGIKVLVHEDDMKENIYCRKCGKKIKLI